MLKYFALLGILVVAAPTLAVAANNQNNNSSLQNSSAGSQNSNGVPFTANDPPATNFNPNPNAISNSNGRPAGFPPVPGCTNGVAKGNPHCQPASP
jgi:hypothetical protein